MSAPEGRALDGRARTPPGAVGRLLLLSGRRGAGKTALCGRLAALAAGEGIPTSGVISHRLPGGRGPRVGLEAEAVPSGERWPLAWVGPLPEGGAGQRAPAAWSWGRFHFLPAGFERAVRLLEEARRSGCRLLLIDEVGPLELVRGLGFRPFLERLAAGDSAGAALPAGARVLVVVRPTLLAEAARLLQPLQPGGPPEAIEVTPGNRDVLPPRILAGLRGPG